MRLRLLVRVVVVFFSIQDIWSKAGRGGSGSHRYYSLALPTPQALDTPRTRVEQ